MTTISGSPCHDLPSSEGRAPHQPPPARALTLAWSLPPASPTGPRRTLEIVIDGPTASASLIDSSRRTALAPPAPIALVYESEHTLWHADAPALIAATWRDRPPGPPEVLFARTPLLNGLAPGGTYEFTGART